MLNWALIFLVISMITGGLGLAGLPATTASYARILSFIAIVIFFTFLMLAVMAGEMLT